MAGETHLTDMVTTGHFRQIKSVFQKHFGLGLEVLDVRGREVAKMCTSGCHPRFCRILKTSKSGAMRCHQDRLRSLSMAFETGQPYISLCHAGIMLVCVPVMEKDIPFSIGIVELDGVGIKLLTRLIGPYSELSLDMPMELEPWNLPDGRIFYKFKPKL